MSDTLLLSLQAIFKTVSDILSAGIAITGFALLLFSLYFNIKNRVIYSFLLILCSIVIIFATGAFAGVATMPSEVELWLRLQWVGIVALPAVYFHFSDALLETTGKPSRWKRKWLVRLIYIVSIGFLVLIPLKLLVGGGSPIDHQQPICNLRTGQLVLSFIILFS